MNKHILPALPYSYGSLEPYIDAKTMEIHHDKHHGGYVSKLNKVLEKYPSLFNETLESILSNLFSIPKEIRNEVRNSAGGHFNHSLFWKIMGKDKGGAPLDLLGNDIIKTFGSMENFKNIFSNEAEKVLGSGWVWVSLSVYGSLVIHSTAKQDNPIMHGLFPIIGLDLWEHAYYLSYQNRRTDYINTFWKIINWRQAEINYEKAQKDRQQCNQHTFILEAA